MKKLNKYIGLMLTAVVASAGFTSCQDDFDAPDMAVPVATLKPNITIAEFKELYWNKENENPDNYVKKIVPRDNGERLVIAGRVISDDADGNIFRSLIIQDETGALSMSIYSYNLYLQYRVGQEVVVDLTDMYAGKYSTIFQLGYPDYSPGYGEQPSFMPRSFFDSHAQLNGMPEISKIDTLVINSFSELGNSQEEMRKFGSQLVRFNNVKFALGGEASFCTAHKVNHTDRVLMTADTDAANAKIGSNAINVRTSGFASFWSTMLPEGAGDVVGIITSYYDSDIKSYYYRLQLRSTSDLLNFGNPTLPKGTEDNPYNVLEGIDMIKSETVKNAWFTGYIVGSLKAGVQTVTSADDIEWSANAEVNNTLVIGQTAQSNTLDDVMLIRLPQESALRTYGNLRDVPENYQKQIWILATPGEQLGMNAFTGNNGTKDEFRIEGVTIPGGDEPSGDGVANGDGTEASPYNPTQVIAKGTDLNETDKWVKGYIVGYVPDKYYNTATNVMPATINSNILLATTPGETDFTKCIPVQLPIGDVRSALNLKDNPGNFGKLCSVHGNLIKYFGVPAIKETDKYVLEGGGTTPPDPVDPGTAVTSLDVNFDGLTSLPADWKTVEQSGNAKWSTYTYSDNTFANVSGYNKTAGATGFESWLITPGLNVDGMTNKTLTFQSMVGYSGNGTLEVYALTTSDPATATATKLNATIAQPTGQWSDWVDSGTISLANFSGTIYIGFVYKAATGSNYTTYRVDNVKAGEEGGTTDPDDPTPPVTGGSSVDFSIFGTAPNTSYTTREADGWTGTWCALGIGVESGENVNAMKFAFVPADMMVLVIDGSVARQGSLVSPTLTGGCSKVTFSYSYPFSEKNGAGFTVNVKQNGTVKATQTVTIEKGNVVSKEVNTFSMDVAGVTGDFTLEINGDAYSASTNNNAERLAVWNLSWAN